MSVRVCVQVRATLRIASFDAKARGDEGGGGAAMRRVVSLELSVVSLASKAREAREAREAGGGRPEGASASASRRGSRVSRDTQLAAADAASFLGGEISSISALRPRELRGAAATLPGTQQRESKAVLATVGGLRLFRSPGQTGYTGVS